MEEAGKIRDVIRRLKDRVEVVEGRQQEIYSCLLDLENMLMTRSNEQVLQQGKAKKKKGGQPVEEGLFL